MSLGIASIMRELSSCFGWPIGRSKCVLSDGMIIADEDMLQECWNDCSIDCDIFSRSLHIHATVRRPINSIATLHFAYSDSLSSMCQARMSVQFSTVLIWTVLGSLTFGFCSIWSLHFVAMLACELDLPIGINVPLTLLSAALAVCFTFAALASDLLWNTHVRRRQKRNRKRAQMKDGIGERPNMAMQEYTSSPLLAHFEEHEDHPQIFQDVESPLLGGDGNEEAGNGTSSDSDSISGNLPTTPLLNGTVSRAALSCPDGGQDISNDHAGRPGVPRRASSQHSASQRSVSIMSSTHSIYSLSNILNLANRVPAKNAFVATGEALYAGCTCRNILKGFLWSLAITSMHYAGIAALRIPSGYSTFEPPLVAVSALISWAVCLVGCVLMAQIETHFAQQFLFAIVACSGVAAMHFTGNHNQAFGILIELRLIHIRDASRHFLVSRWPLRRARLSLQSCRRYRYDCYHYLHSSKFLARSCRHPFS